MSLSEKKLLISFSSSGFGIELFLLIKIKNLNMMEIKTLYRKTGGLTSK
jgi:hypothetical protein